MKNEEIAKKLQDIANLLEIKGENPFKIRSYANAAETVSSLPEDIAKIADRGEISSLPGIGKSIAEKIGEFLETGKINYLEELKKQFPDGLLKMLAVPGLGPKKIRILFEKLNIRDIRGLEIAVRRGDVAKLPGFGEKTAENIMRGVEFLSRSAGRFLVVKAKEIVDDFGRWLTKNKGCENWAVCGSYRRGCETIGDLDILALSKNPEKLIKEFTERKYVAKVSARGKTKGSVITVDNIQVDLRVVEKKSWGAALLYFTGSKKHNIHLREFAVKKNLTLNEYGLYRKTKTGAGKFLAGSTEKEVYEKLGMQYIPPELREDSGEIALAAEQKLPELVEEKDIKGDLHVHSTYSDGAFSIAQMAEAGLKMGYEWIAICDHSRSLKIANGVSIKDLMRKKEEIRELNKKSRIKILFGAEVDILKDGSLDYPDEILSQLDVCLAAVHTGFKQPADEMNRRLLIAMENPYVDIIAHPTARLIGKRNPIAVDVDMLIEKAAEKNIVLEVNSYPDRLDLKDSHIREAVRRGAKLSLGCDAHSIKHLNYRTFGVKTLRRGWAKRGDVINTMSAPRLLNFIKMRREIKK
ncbi:MAG: DNA polymerase/3'-5' exonuclease PolX [Elusimicrobia bacterium]|nr:DNA polymerase/3'-5' exonuclease PolX [Elusimicrobiota bacterium]